MTDQKIYKGFCGLLSLVPLAWQKGEIQKSVPWSVTNFTISLLQSIFFPANWVNQKKSTEDHDPVGFGKSEWILFTKTEIHKQPSCFYFVTHTTISLEAMYYFRRLTLFFWITVVQLIVESTLLKQWQNCDNCSVSLSFHSPAGLCGCLVG